MNYIGMGRRIRPGGTRKLANQSYIRGRQKTALSRPMRTGKAFFRTYTDKG
jgi:hypothetical protein